MKTVKFISFFLVFLLSGNARAAANFHCQMKWNLLSGGNKEKTFILQKNTTLVPYPHMEVFLEKEKQHSKVSIVQSYGVKNQNNVSYYLECSGFTNCIGARDELIDGKKTDTKFIMTSNPNSTIAVIGQREIFHFQQVKDGFAYRFIQYRLSSGGPAGMELICHE